MSMPELLHHIGVQYKTYGKNISAGWFNICCPFCGDTAYHCGYNPEGSYFHCWKCGGHSVERTLGKLTKQPAQSVSTLMFRFGIAKSTKKVGERLKRASDVVIDPEKEKNYKKLGVGLTNPYKKYLEGRGLDWRFVSRMFKLRCINYAHKYRSRIIIPVIQNDVEVSWVSRSILDDPSVRYVNCPKADEVISLKETLFNMDNTANTVLVTEGAFDVMAVGHGCVSTLGVKYTPVQLDMLKSYRRVFIWYDPDKSGMRAAEKLASDLGYHVSVEILESDMDLSETNKHYPDEIIKIKRELLL